MGKKTGSAGKFGARYGMRTRKKWQEIDERQRKLHECPTCNRISVRRISTAIWECRKCGAKFAGGAYSPVTGAAKSIERVVKRLTEEEEGQEENGGEEEDV
ncbi:MAG: 50S ribosomal protein L37ae [Candidatus Hydrothermarchaeales archaeon]